MARKKSRNSSDSTASRRKGRQKAASSTEQGHRGSLAAIGSVLMISAILHRKDFSTMLSDMLRRVDFSTVVPPTEEAKSSTTVTREEANDQQQQQQQQQQEFPLPRIAYIAIGHLNSTDRWDGVLHPATDYFVPDPDPYYIAMNEQWQSAYDNLVKTHNSTFQRYAPRIQPIYVNCAEGKGTGSCCKQDQALTQFAQNYYYLDNPDEKRNRKTRYDWICFQDDDEYIRHDAMQEFLRYLPVTDEPIVLATDAPRGSNGKTGDDQVLYAHRLGQTGYVPRRSPYQCTGDLPNFTYPWGQPVFYNRAAFELLQPAFAAGAMTQLCRDFGLYAHDTGNALLHWMFSIPAIWMRNPNNVKTGGYRSDFLGMHRVSRDGPASAMKVVHETYLHKYPYDTSGNRPPYMWSSNATGFRQTQTYHQYGDPSTWGTQWHPFPTSDCGPWLDGP